MGINRWLVEIRQPVPKKTSNSPRSSSASNFTVRISTVRLRVKTLAVPKTIVYWKLSPLQKPHGIKLGDDRGNIRDIAAKGQEKSRAVRVARADAKAADLSTTIEQIKAESDSLSLGQLAAV